MKKAILILVTLNLFIVAFAQEEEVDEGPLVNKKGTAILPVSGDFSIGIGAAPFFEYAGNIFNGTSNNGSPGFGFTDEKPMMITGKYMLDENTAIRGIFRAGFGNVKTIGDVYDDVSTELMQVEDTYTTSYTNIGIGGGLEKNRGKGRLRGVYGGQVIFMIESNSDTYEYANFYSATNLNPTRTDFGSNDHGGAWTIENKSGLGFGASVQGFVGVEFFFAPKLSLSGEFTYGLHYMNQAKSSESIQSWDAVNAVVQEDTFETGGSSSFGLDTGIGAYLNVNFYF